MWEFYEKNKHFIQRIMITILLTIGVYIFFRYLFSFIAPFVVAWVISSLMEPMVRWFNKKWKLARGVSSILSIIIVLGLVGGMLTVIVIEIVEQARAFGKDIPMYYSSFMITIENIKGRTENFIFSLPLHIQNLLAGGMGIVIKGFPNILGSSVRRGSIGIVVALPNALFFGIVALIATFFMSKDRKRIQNFMERQMPRSWIRKFDTIKRDLFGALLGYIKTQFILMLFIITICTIGLSILRFKYSFLIGIVTGIVDAFPILGSGTILIPLAIYNGISGNLYGAIGLLIIYGIVILFRQMLEPKVLASQIGVYPLVTLMSMYIGIRLFGFVGIIIGPVFVIFLKTMQKIGIIPPWR
ncbi:MAG: sporulation integral membrane protein YtvI [Epulopiscium sp.]|nr:sporulation integral membrane protein YtvI [Candidatus Epulonipiscium sp.]